MSLPKFVVKMFSSRKTLKITDLPPNILERILMQLDFEDLLTVKEVSVKLNVACKSIIEIGLLNTLNSLRVKISKVEDHMKSRSVTLENKLKLNQVHTKLQILAINLFSVYVLTRHCLKNMDYFTIASVLDEIIAELTQMNNTEVLTWPMSDFVKSDMLSKLNLCNAVYEHSNLPFGVYIMDILDLLMGINYTISCDYDTLKNSCSVNASYFTDNTKFLLYLPDFSFMKDCQDRKLSQAEEEGILKYLLLIVNLYNGMFYKNEEYNNEILLRNSAYNPVKSTVEICRKQLSRTFQDVGRILETYEKIVEYDGSLNNKRNGGLLLCEMYLECSLAEAPFQIQKSYENLRNHLVLEEYQHINLHQTTSVNAKDYGAKIKLKICVQNKCTEGFEVNILDGNRISDYQPNYLS
ncbi:PREDICTED: uncharacterized protein LOC108558912 isoform X2 [Nicrophorus vespilloides]|uniref:Uncharacterized protein LOC108558912 isoform X2 n=1 Tax=Nicrophorus vespilloides TaxID=110193 RepID=A0ABM1MA74_NICVS|nr:PREDICTED: uncharacterized protein LOC108558912 isoform X2 [Nicrophorus vespilloides]